LYEKGKEIVAEAVELVEDTVAEAKAELEEAGKK
jgi:predicted HTH domain antitoxin